MIMKKELFFNDETIIAFHIGRGGKYNNQGFLTCEGEHTIGDFTDDLFAPTDEDGNEIDGEYTDDCGNGVGLATEDVRYGVGTINIDGDYNTTYTTMLCDIEPNSDEAYAMVNNSDSFTREQAILYFISDIQDENAKRQLLLDLGLDDDEIEDYL